MTSRTLPGPRIALLMLSLAACTTAPPAATVPATPVVAAPPPAAAPNVADLVGARAAGGESEMTSRGYSVARQRGLTAYWWNATGRHCVQTVTANGRYRTVQPVAASACGH